MRLQPPIISEWVMRLSSLLGTLILHEVAGDFVCFFLVITLFHTPGNYKILGLWISCNFEFCHPAPAPSD